MTTTVQVQSHNFPVKVQIIDRVWDDDKQAISDEPKITDTVILWPEHGVRTFHATTTRAIAVVDLEMDDPEALAVKPKAE